MTTVGAHVFWGMTLVGGLPGWTVTLPRLRPFKGELSFRTLRAEIVGPATASSGDSPYALHRNAGKRHPHFLSAHPHARSEPCRDGGWLGVGDLAKAQGWEAPTSPARHVSTAYFTTTKAG